MIRPMYRKVHKEIHIFFIPVNQETDFQQFLIHKIRPYFDKTNVQTLYSQDNVHTSPRMIPSCERFTRCNISSLFDVQF